MSHILHPQMSFFPLFFSRRWCVSGKVGKSLALTTILINNSNSITNFCLSLKPLVGMHCCTFARCISVENRAHSLESLIEGQFLIFKPVCRDSSEISFIAKAAAYNSHHLISAVHKHRLRSAVTCSMQPEWVFVNLLRSPGNDSHIDGIDSWAP